MDEKHSPILDKCDPEKLVWFGQKDETKSGVCDDCGEFTNDHCPECGFPLCNNCFIANRMCKFCQIESTVT